MVFYIIAAAVKNVEEEAVEAKIKGVKSITNTGRIKSTVHKLNVSFDCFQFFVQIDKSQFKTGAFDQLMALNEVTGKIDGQLDTLCKKFEKVAFDNGTQKLTYAMPNNRDTSKFPF
jgi:hypothetical protein